MKYTRESLGPVVAASTSMAEVLRALGLKPTGGNYRYISDRIRAFDLDDSHFKGQAWNRGLTKATSASIRIAAERHSYPDDLVFVRNCKVSVRGSRLGTRLIKLGRPYACACCGIAEWRGAPLTLHLDHVNGINNDNRLENLRFLCPNCHQQTHTWGNRKRGRRGDGGPGEVREAPAAYRRWRRPVSLMG